MSLLPSRPLSRELTSGDLADLLPRLRRRETRAVARAISMVERGGPLQAELLREIYPATGRARVVGITGPPASDAEADWASDSQPPRYSPTETPSPSPIRDIRLTFQ